MSLLLGQTGRLRRICWMTGVAQIADIATRQPANGRFLKLRMGLIDPKEPEANGSNRAADFWSLISAKPVRTS